MKSRPRDGMHQCSGLLEETGAPGPGLPAKCAILLATIGRRASFNDVARRLDMPVRTLHRKLREQDTSFRDIMDQLRHELAVKYLRDTGMTIGDIAHALGFSDAANFRHAFRRWSKLSPQAFRRAAGAEIRTIDRAPSKKLKPRSRRAGGASGERLRRPCTARRGMVRAHRRWHASPAARPAVLAPSFRPRAKLQRRTIKEPTMPRAVPELQHFKWITEHDLRFSDMDPIGHVNNGAYTSLMESSRGALLLTEAMSKTGDVRFVLARLDIDFLRELKWPGRVKAATGVVHVGTTSLRLRQGVFTHQGCAAAASAVLVAVDPEGHRPTPISQSARDILQRWRMININGGNWREPNSK